MPEVGSLFSTALDELINAFEVGPVLRDGGAGGGGDGLQEEDSHAVDVLRTLVAHCGGVSSFSADVREFRRTIAYHK